ncbi:amino acid ABC transporter substrate-binding protein [Kitasatospora phosalacinea]|uniref:Amino acid ABC transporter substrate-binding protein n=1 Tax=Kitasatospora phosalacinea TaxID=2065 RepID=A0A9W6QC87_9ACTN|nr:ABC transporter substrate-binding protein [Kitasatospora phosalacinea]GLW71907.1 amino acid ABC transporter substrate-binding protein [Kitasatospora phosalacinea]
MSGSSVRVGALVPLGRPGWVAAGRQLLAGLELGVADVNAAGGIGGRPVELLVRDTAADPVRAVAAVEELAGLGVSALAGEYHSVVARAVATRAEELGVPYVCASAVLDGLVDAPARRVARIAPAQSYGWRVYAEFLLGAGHRRIAVAADPGAYWAAGTEVLREHLAVHGGEVVGLDARDRSPGALCDALAASGAGVLLLLVGHPEPAVPLVRAVRRDPRLGGVLLGAPAGQPELPDWVEQLGADGAAVPFLRYLPERFTPHGARVDAALRELLGAEPSFVAFEGWDAMAALAAALRAAGDGSGRALDWAGVEVAGTRGTVRFSRVPGSGVWQWARPPVQVADRDPAEPGRFRVLHAVAGREE